MTVLVGTARRAALPLAAYYFVTLALPVANGATLSGAAFMEHALVVLVVPPILVLLGCALRAIVRNVRRRHAT